MTEKPHIDVIKALDSLNKNLRAAGLRRTFVICGSASLILQRISGDRRATTDIDVITPDIDPETKTAALLVADHLGISPDWFNSDPKGLAKDMSPGWELRVLEIYTASNLVIQTISRTDMIFAKFYAYCDRQKDLQDLIDLKISSEELKTASNLTKKMDTNPLWPKHVDDQMLKLKRKLGHEE